MRAVGPIDEPRRDREERAAAPPPAPGPSVPRGASNRDVAAWVAKRRGGSLQRRVTLPAGLSTVTLDEADAERARRGDNNSPGPIAYGAVAAELSGAARARLDEWITDGVARRFTSRRQLVAALKCHVQFTSATEWTGVDWVAGLPAWAAGEAFQPVRGRDIGAIARTRLRNLVAGPEIATFTSRAVLKAALQTWAAQQIEDLITGGVHEQDLDVAIAMYERLDLAGQGAEAILHKLEFRGAHSRQYATRGVNEHTASNTGLVYGPWRASPGGAPTAGPQQVAGSVNVHTMPLNVAWLLACCHHQVTFRLYSPLTRRAMIREQGTLSALGRELMALVAGGFYEVSEPEAAPVTWPATEGFTSRTSGVRTRDALAPMNQTYVLRPTANAKNATVAALTVPNNRTWGEVRTALNDRGLSVEENPNLDAAIKRMAKASESYQAHIVEMNAALAQAAMPLALDAYNSAVAQARLNYNAARNHATRWGLPNPPALNIPAHTPPVAHAGVI
jgi:hypothetical protein